MVKLRIVRSSPQPSGSPGSSGSSGSHITGGPTSGQTRTVVEGAIDVPVDGLKLAEDLLKWLRRYIVTMDERDLLLLVAWILHTHLADEVYTTPRLIIDSPVPASGKTTLLEHLSRLCFNPILAASINSAALLTRLLQEGPRTILIDEADRTLSPDKSNVSELLAVLNSGYKKGATRPVLVPHKDNAWAAKEMPTFAPVAMAGNHPQLPEDTRSRSLRVLLMPDTRDLAEESDWELIEPQTRELHERITSWANSVRELVRQNRAELPPGVRGRSRERWAPLKRVATAVGGRWPAAIDELACADVARIEAEREEGLEYERPEVVLLKDIHTVWGLEEAFIPTEELVERLVHHSPEMWGMASTFAKELSAQRLGRMLVKGYDIHSDRAPHGKRERGYQRSRFEPVFRAFRLGHSDELDEPDDPDDPDQGR